LLKLGIIFKKSEIDKFAAIETAGTTIEDN